MITARTALMSDAFRRLRAWMILVPWFLLMNWIHLSGPEFTADVIGIDAQLYWRGSHAWVTGSDPWAQTTWMHGPFHYSGSPLTILVFAPFTALPETIFRFGWLAASGLAAMLIIRRLHLAWWWVLFPPLMEGLIAANPHVVLLALLLFEPVAWIAPLLKVYAAAPLLILGRWRPILIALAVTPVSILAFPDLWMDYLRRFGEINATLANDAWIGFSASRSLALFIPAALCWLVLLRCDRQAAAWLVVPALWPSSQFFYASFALPVAAPIVGFVLGIPFRGMTGVFVIALAVTALLFGRRGKPIALLTRGGPQMTHD